MEYRIADPAKGGFCVCDDLGIRKTQVWETREMAEDWLRRALSDSDDMPVGANAQWHVKAVEPFRKIREARKIRAPQQKLVWGRWESRSFSWDAFGHSEAEVRKLMRAQWKRHVKQTGADPSYFDADQDIDFTVISAGLTLRDREEF